jgi:hypothetical protein
MVQKKGEFEEGAHLKGDCRVAVPLPPNLRLNNTDFVDTMM